MQVMPVFPFAGVSGELSMKASRRAIELADVIIIKAFVCSSLCQPCTFLAVLSHSHISASHSCQHI
jgi:hypothetical protein